MALSRSWRARGVDRGPPERGGRDAGSARSTARMIRRGKTSYATIFLVSVAAIAPAAAYTFWLMRPTSSSASESPSQLPLEAGDAFDVKNVASIRPRPEAYVPFAEEDRLWRENAVARMFAAMRTDGPDVPWKPDAEQVLATKDNL